MRLGVAKRRERGDTIIEVMFAIAIFSFVAISSLAIMNRGVATGERALEVTLVRQQINAQAEALRYIHEARVAVPDGPQADTWRRFLSTDSNGYRQSRASEYGALSSEGRCELPSSGRPFILNAKTATIWPGELSAQAGDAAGSDAQSYPPYSQVVYDSADPLSVSAAYGMWIEAVPHDADTSGTGPDKTRQAFIDFHIRACWDVPGSSIPMTLGTIVRLYDPAV